MKMESSGAGWYLTDEEWILKENMRKVMDEEISPRFMEAFTEETAVPYYHDAMKRFGELGFLRLSVPEELGGYGMRYTASLLAVEEMSRGCGGLAVHVIMNPMFGMIMAKACPKAWEEWGEKLLSGDAIYAGCMTQAPGNGNVIDWDAMVTKVDGGYMLNGEKVFCSGGTFADILTCQALDAEHNMYMLAFTRETEGVTTHVNPEVGLSPSTASFTFDNVFIPDGWGGPMPAPGSADDNEETDGGWKIGAVSASMQSLGTAEAAYDMALEYASQRDSWGRKVIQYGAIQQKFVDMKIKIEATRSLIYTTARMMEAGQKEWPAWADMCKILSSKIAMEVSGDAIELFGCLGVNPETGIMRFHLDSIGEMISTGTPDLHYPAAAENLGWPASDDPGRF